jgi:hypothetical protein
MCQNIFYSQATRHARRVYVGGLPPNANEQVSILNQLFFHYATPINLNVCACVFYLCIYAAAYNLQMLVKLFSFSADSCSIL